MIVRELTVFSSVSKVVQAERQAFFLTKVLPYIGYLRTLDNCIDAKLLNGRKAKRGAYQKSPFLRKEIYDCIYKCFCAYDLTIGIWQEYRDVSAAERQDQAWSDFVSLYSQNENPILKDLNGIVPYPEFRIGVWIYKNPISDFSHDNYRDFFAALHIANVVYLLSNGYALLDLDEHFQDVFVVQIESFDQSILLDAQDILMQYFDVDFSKEDTFEDKLTRSKDDFSELTLTHVFIQLLSATIQHRSRAYGRADSWMFKKRFELYKRFSELYEDTRKDWPDAAEKYSTYYTNVLSKLAWSYRLGKGVERNLSLCAGYAELVIRAEKEYDIPNADGYLQMGLCLNAYMEDLLNGKAKIANWMAPRIPQSKRTADRIYKAFRVLCVDEDIKSARSLFNRLLGRSCWYNKITFQCADAFYMMIDKAHSKYSTAKGFTYRLITRLGYISKAYLAIAAIATSGGAINTLAQMLINQANYIEGLKGSQFSPELQKDNNSDLFYSLNGEDNNVLAFRLLWTVCNIKRGSQPYSQVKAAELVLKGKVSINDGVQRPRVPDDKGKHFSSEARQWLQGALAKGVSGDATMAYYWLGRFYLESEDENEKRNAKECFLLMGAGDFDYENSLKSSRQIPINIWLTAIELFAFSGDDVFKCDRCTVYEAVCAELHRQIETVKNLQRELHNDRYWLTADEVQNNIERFRDRLKTGHNDKIEFDNTIDNLLSILKDDSKIN